MAKKWSRKATGNDKSAPRIGNMIESDRSRASSSPVPPAVLFSSLGIQFPVDNSQSESNDRPNARGSLRTTQRLE